jgi:hypothetical protein
VDTALYYELSVSAEFPGLVPFTDDAAAALRAALLGGLLPGDELVIAILDYTVAASVGTTPALEGGAALAPLQAALAEALLLEGTQSVSLQTPAGEGVRRRARTLLVDAAAAASAQLQQPLPLRGSRRRLSTAAPPAQLLARGFGADADAAVAVAARMGVAVRGAADAAGVAGALLSEPLLSAVVSITVRRRTGGDAFSAAAPVLDAGTLRAALAYPGLQALVSAANAAVVAAAAPPPPLPPRMPDGVPAAAQPPLAASPLSSMPPQPPQLPPTPPMPPLPPAPAAPTTLVSSAGLRLDVAALAAGVGVALCACACCVRLRQRLRRRAAIPTSLVCATAEEEARAAAKAADDATRGAALWTLLAGDAPPPPPGASRRAHLAALLGALAPSSGGKSGKDDAADGDEPAARGTSRLAALQTLLAAALADAAAERAAAGGDGVSRLAGLQALLGSVGGRLAGRTRADALRNAADPRRRARIVAELDDAA